VVLEDIGWLASATGLPVLVKGILHPDDARLALEAAAFTLPPVEGNV
jgi:4-hydroxymandelate oxidase